MSNPLTELVNEAIIEAQMVFSKEHSIPLCIARIEYEPDNDSEKFKDIIAFIHAFIDYNPILTDKDNTYILFLKNVRIHTAVKMMKKLIFSLKIKYSTKIKRVSLTSVDYEDTLFSLLERLNRYFLLLKTSKEEEIFYGTKDFDFLAEKDKATLLSTIFKKDPHIKLHNFFKNIPLIEKAIIKNFQKDLLQIQINPQKLSFYKKEKSIYLEHNLLPDILKADIFKIDFSKSLLYLYNLEFLDSSPVDREDIRVKPHKTVIVQVGYAGKVLFEGIIVDLSINSILLATQLAKLEKISSINIENIEFDLKFSLPLGNKESLIVIKGKIYKILGNQVVFNIIPNTVQKSKLSSYIAMRQHELIKELEKEMDKNNSYAM